MDNLIKQLSIFDEKNYSNFCNLFKLYRTNTTEFVITSKCENRMFLDLISGNINDENYLKVVGEFNNLEKYIEFECKKCNLFVKRRKYIKCPDTKNLCFSCSKLYTFLHYQNEFVYFKIKEHNIVVPIFCLRYGSLSDVGELLLGSFITLFVLNYDILNNQERDDIYNILHKIFKYLKNFAHFDLNGFKFIEPRLCEVIDELNNYNIDNTIYIYTLCNLTIIEQIVHHPVNFTFNFKIKCNGIYYNNLFIKKLQNEKIVIHSLTEYFKDFINQNINKYVDYERSMSTTLRLKMLVYSGESFNKQF